MLLQFSVNNFKSIKDTATISMISNPSKKEKANSFSIRGYNLLNIIAIYGANASGKSNVLHAMSYMGSMVLNKHKIFQSTDEIPHHPFRLSTTTKDSSSTFEIVFFIKNIKYRYGFEADKEIFYSEWLYADEKGKEAKLFYRDLDGDNYVNQNKFKEGYQFFDKSSAKIKIGSNQLFLWKCDREEDGLISKSILSWFKNFQFLDSLESMSYAMDTVRELLSGSFKNDIVNLVKTADIGIQNIFGEEKKLTDEDLSKINLPELFRKQIVKDSHVSATTIKTMHNLYDESDVSIEEVEFDLGADESTGTKKFFEISAPILKTLQEGKILIIDELDASLHPLLTMHLIELFHNPKTNPKNAQLIFTTHDTNLLKPYIFNREQIWFTEKNKYGSTDIYALSQIKNVRISDDFEKHYIQGKYGAVPYIGKFEFANG